MDRTTIIIPVYNQARLTERCLQALGRGDFEVVVVDDASTDETPRLLENLVPAIKVVRHSVNQCFATSCNHGAAVASGEFLVFLNNDTLPQPGWLEALVSYADAHPEASAIGSKLVYPDRTIQHAGVVICQDQYPRHIYTGFPADHPAVNKSRPFQIVTAACMLVRRSAFGRLGGFDASFRNGFEDVDFCLRLRQAGHQIHYCAESQVEHLESVSPGRFRYAGNNVARYREKWFGRVRRDDVDYYLADGLMEFTYEGSFPLTLSVSPRLALLAEAQRESQTERLLAEATQQITDLRRENTRLSLHVSTAQPESEAARYDQLKHRIRQAVQLKIPTGATVLVVSKGDRALLDLGGRPAWHFPQTDSGVYAGYHPEDSSSAIAHLEALREKGAQYLLFPKTALWWLDFYRELERHLIDHYQLVANDPDTCLIFDLHPATEMLSRSAAIGRAGRRNPLASRAAQKAGSPELHPLSSNEASEP